ncbi:MAG TPA: indole-3-glycerol phosphate synthase TrpC [Alphaproteobacteria bacterium]
MSDALARICAAKRAEIGRRKAARPFAALVAGLAEAPPPRPFAAALDRTVAAGGAALIAEIKKASPSKGVICADFDPPALARAYQDGGAACLSVLTDGPYFQGADDHLVKARGAVGLPTLRKDFMLDVYQVLESRLLGADCILVIMAAVSDAVATELADAATATGMDALAEVHDAAELERALRLGAGLIGINNRDLKTLAVDLATTERLAPLVPAGRAVVCESGIADAGDIARMRGHGVDRFLVGESLMRQADVAAATRALLAPPPARRAAG